MLPSFPEHGRTLEALLARLMRRFNLAKDSAGEPSSSSMSSCVTSSKPRLISRRTYRSFGARGTGVWFQPLMTSRSGGHRSGGIDPLESSEARMGQSGSDRSGAIATHSSEQLVRFVVGKCCLLVRDTNGLPVSFNVFTPVEMKHFSLSAVIKDVLLAHDCFPPNH